jgi:hypothetical protein
MRIICSLTTIPSRLPRLEKTIDSLLDQTVLPDKIYIHIPIVYNFRFAGTKVNQDIINLFLARYANYKDIVVFHTVAKDQGPGTKLLGFFNTPEWGDAATKDTDDFVLVIDDDVKYPNTFIQTYINNILLNGVGAKKVYTFQNYDIKNLDERDKIYVGMCVAGFCINVKFLRDFPGFFEKVGKYDFVLYHDELYMSYYAGKLQGLEIENISNGSSYTVIENTYVDALNQIRGAYKRETITPHILEVFDRYYPHVLAGGSTKSGSAKRSFKMF